MKLVPNHQGANLQKITTTVCRHTFFLLQFLHSLFIIGWLEPWEDRHKWSAIKLLGSGRTRGTTSSLGQILSGTLLFSADAILLSMLQECHAIIYVVDSSDRERIEQSKETFNSMIKNENVRGVPLLVAANKQDLVDCMGVREVKPLFEANLDLVGAREVMTLATSGLTGDGVVEGIDWVAQCVVRNADVRAPHDSAR